MKKFEVTYWRGNPQHANGGYQTKRTYEVKNEKELNKAIEKTCDCRYGDMEVMEIKEII